ncbi:MAG: efflux RND transporter periplasmic adaptor subunit [Chitinophagaceae bacterium]
MFMYNKIFIPFFIAVLCLLLFSSCREKPIAKDEKKGYVLTDSMMKVINVKDVVLAQERDAITLTGKVAFNDDNVAKLYPLVSGNVTGVKVVLGDYVNAGQELALVRSSEMAGFGSDLVSAESNLRMARLNLEKTTDMYHSGLASMPDSLNAAIVYEQAKATLNRVNQVLKINGGGTKGDYIVKAPHSGFIVEKNVTNNMTIRTDNGNAMFTISDLKNVWVWANVYESNIDRVHVGDKADVETISYPGKIFTGKVDKIMNVLDPTNKVMKVRVMLPNDSYILKPEMFTSVTISNQLQKQAITIPSSALIFDHSQYFVIVFKSKSELTITPVEIINTVGSNTYIAKGLQVGQKVIASNALQIYNQLNN